LLIGAWFARLGHLPGRLLARSPRRCCLSLNFLPRCRQFRHELLGLALRLA
jgi:hypothetical protein